MTVAALTSAGRVLIERLVPRSPAADGPPDGSEDPEDRADDEQHDADIGEDRYAEQQPKDEQDRTEDDHGHSVSRRIVKRQWATGWACGTLQSVTFGLTPA